MTKEIYNSKKSLFEELTGLDAKYNVQEYLAFLNAAQLAEINKELKLLTDLTTRQVILLRQNLPGSSFEPGGG